MSTEQELQEIEELESQQQQDALEEEEDTSPPKPPALPEDFDPSLYGFVKKDDYDALTTERNTLDARLKETQGAFHQGQTQLRQELQSVNQRMDQLASMRSQPIHQQADRVQTLLQRYQTTQDINDYHAYNEAVTDSLIEKRMGSQSGGQYTPQQQYQPHQHQQQQQQVDPYTAVQQAMAQQMYLNNPDAIPIPELEASMTHQPLTLDEVATVVRMRRAGGSQKHAETLRNEGVKAWLTKSGIKTDGNLKPIGTLPTIGGGTHRLDRKPLPQLANIDQLGDSQALDAINKLEEEYNKNVRE